MRFLRSLSVLLLVLGWSIALAEEEPPKTDAVRGDRMIAEYFRLETAKLSDACLADIQTLDDWKKRREEYRRQLLEMLGLDPLPSRSPLNTTVTGKVEHDEFTVENLHFQSRPGLYVTGNLFLPRKVEGRLPAILYVCGHAGVKKDGISYGNKAFYQRHGEWFARNGYVCLVIDSLQLGEIEGIHHGTYRYGMWWWLNRGYTPAGVEAWNCVRALDYLQSRPEVDPERLGVTGRSGGGAYSWWIAAIDDRIKAAVPVAGITDLQNHVVDGCVEGHCDCMFCVNTYRWDYPIVAALVAPRPLLIGNTDSDSIFPLDGVIRTFEKVRKIYRLYGAAENVAVAITWGPHQDMQELQVPAMRWFNQHLQGSQRLVENAAINFLEPEQLRVFKELPLDQTNAGIHESFVPRASNPPIPADAVAWADTFAGWRQSLDEKCFGAWPKTAEPLNLAPACDVASQGVRLRAWDFTSQGPVRLRLYLATAEKLAKPERVTLRAFDEKTWPEFLAAYRCAFENEFRGEIPADANPAAWQEIQRQLGSGTAALAYVAPRGIGPTAWDPSEKKQTQHRRRFYLLGQTLDSMRVWDLRRTVNALREAGVCGEVPVKLQSREVMAANCLYAALYEPAVDALVLDQLPATHRTGPYYLNVERFLDMPQTLAMVALAMSPKATVPLGRSVTLLHANRADWQYAEQIREKMGWPETQLQFLTGP
jgi:dienelactone hydrolase